MRKFSMMILLGGALAGGPAQAGEPRAATLYKDPQCGCWEAYADHLRESGFEVTVTPTHQLPQIKRQHGVPSALEGCHTTLVDGYVVEGHVPVATLLRLLAEKPDIRGISLPGMPAGSPGMSGEKTAPFTIYEIGEGQPRLYAVE